MVSKSKLYDRLDQLELEFEERLVKHLQVAAEGGNELVFCVKGFHSFDQLRAHSDKVTEELVSMGSQVLSLRQKLGEPVEGTPAARICWYCREWGNTDNHHRSGAQGLARQFLNEIQPKT